MEFSRKVELILLRNKLGFGTTFLPYVASSLYLINDFQPMVVIGHYLIVKIEMP